VRSFTNPAFLPNFSKESATKRLLILREKEREKNGRPHARASYPRCGPAFMHQHDECDRLPHARTVTKRDACLGVHRSVWTEIEKRGVRDLALSRHKVVAMALPLCVPLDAVTFTKQRRVNFDNNR
jgi:hypothetical protein